MDKLQDILLQMWPQLCGDTPEDSTMLRTFINNFIDNIKTTMSKYQINVTDVQVSQLEEQIQVLRSEVASLEEGVGTLSRALNIQSGEGYMQPKQLPPSDQEHEKRAMAPFTTSGVPFSCCPTSQWPLLQRADFPSSFTFGVATSAYQNREDGGLKLFSADDLCQLPRSSL
ncbi:hypothetical protein GOP47_0024763 [Adiantum capillus-veneris]|uniref:Uncharacterized protein n=1 Tax=Adiantum capillus-veneris TaxID=13818 RepID=A0A9D4U2Q0_ADICA|nr:hypothetical protein GOP47_0024763 [Adiantum capillus-veneris]